MPAATPSIKRGDIVWSYFPDRLSPLNPGRKFRPGFVTGIYRHRITRQVRALQIAYMTTQENHDKRYALTITRTDQLKLLKLSGKSCCIDFTNIRAVPFTQDFFGSPLTAGGSIYDPDLDHLAKALEARLKAALDARHEPNIEAMRSARGPFLEL